MKQYGLYQKNTQQQQQQQQQQQKTAMGTPIGETVWTVQNKKKIKHCTEKNVFQELANHDLPQRRSDTSDVIYIHT